MANVVSPNQMQIQIGLVLLVRPDTRDDTSQPWCISIMKRVPQCNVDFAIAFAAPANWNCRPFPRLETKTCANLSHVWAPRPRWCSLYLTFDKALDDLKIAIEQSYTKVMLAMYNASRTPKICLVTWFALRKLSTLEWRSKFGLKQVTC